MLQNLHWLIDLFIFNKSGFSFAVQKLENISSNPGEVNFESLVHIFIYIRDNKTLGSKYYPDMNDALYSLYVLD